MISATGTQTETPATFSRADLEALAQRETKPGSPVLSVYLDTDQSREINIERGIAAFI
jgi:hypothetical protein